VLSNVHLSLSHYAKISSQKAVSYSRKLLTSQLSSREDVSMDAEKYPLFESVI
jgi:hypothetical protein